MDAVELQHWMRLAATRAAVVAVTSIHDMIDKSRRRVAEENRRFQARKAPCQASNVSKKGRAH